MPADPLPPAGSVALTRRASRRVHDIGGEPAGPCRRTRHDFEDWERRIDAMVMILRRSNLVTVDEMRRQIESLGSCEYRQASYYERWAQALAGILIERGVLSVDELARRMETAK